MRLVFWFCLCLTSFAFADYRPDRDGAETVVGLTVLDLDGKPVHGAKVMFRVFTTFPTDCRV